MVGKRVRVRDRVSTGTVTVTVAVMVTRTGTLKIPVMVMVRVRVDGKVNFFYAQCMHRSMTSHAVPYARMPLRAHTSKHNSDLLGSNQTPP